MPHMVNSKISPLAIGKISHQNESVTISTGSYQTTFGNGLMKLKKCDCGKEWEEKWNCGQRWDVRISYKNKEEEDHWNRHKNIIKVLKMV